MSASPSWRTNNGSARPSAGFARPWIGCDRAQRAEIDGPVGPGALAIALPLVIGFIDVQALAGDSSDNVPGIPGIGEKTAVALINEFGTVENLLANLELNPAVPAWAGLETEVGEIKGTEGLSTVDDATFLIQGLNGHDIFPLLVSFQDDRGYVLKLPGHASMLEYFPHDTNVLYYI